VFQKNTYLKQWVTNILPIEQNISNQGQVLGNITENIILWTDKTLVNSFGILLLLLCVVCAIQYIMLKKKKRTDRIQHKWIK
jgi:type II secretory pathway component PulF